jgi:hypothetical protein
LVVPHDAGIGKLICAGSTAVYTVHEPIVDAKDQLIHNLFPTRPVGKPQEMSLTVIRASSSPFSGVRIGRSHERAASSAELTRHPRASRSLDVHAAGGV